MRTHPAEAVPELPEPVDQPEPPATDVPGLETALRGRMDGEVRFDSGTRAAYSTDASNYRQVPIGVVVPRTPEDAVTAVAVAREHDVPVLSRGGATSLAGQCTNSAIVIDWSKYCHHLESVDPESRTCVVQPGIVLDELNRQLGPTELEFGPKPSTHPNCTLGGMIGNNSCGSTAQRTGKVVDNIVEIEVLCYDGTRFWCGPTSDEEYRRIERRGDRRAEIYRQLRHLTEVYDDRIREGFPHIPRRVSGYNLNLLLPENGFDIAGLLTGSESTLVTVLRARLTLVPVLKNKAIVVLGYPSIDQAADAAPKILPHRPIALEGLDAKLLRNEETKNLHSQARARLPQGKAFLLVQFGADTTEEADAQARNMLQDLQMNEHQADVALVEDPEQEESLWRVREAGLGATAHVPGHPDTFPGWEDSAVAPEKLGDYLRRLALLYEEFGYSNDAEPSLYGHFGEGCVHTRIPFDLFSAGGVANYRKFVERAADLVTEFGGSLSGEHGDGQARGELLSRMFGADLMRAFGQLKTIFDPENRMNPGKVPAPYPLDANLRLGKEWSPTAPQDLYFRYPHDAGSFIQAANRCVGIGRCRQHATTNEVMCPSYQVTGEEKHSTRGRARLLFEMLNGHDDGPVTDGWRSEAVHEALDLCLACKGCKKDCPVDVDMATYKAEFLAHHYQGRQWRRPRAHLSLGWLPLLAKLVSRLRLAPAVNTLAQASWTSRLATAAAGIENRELPTFATETLQEWFTRRGARGTAERGTVLLWPDTFTNHFHPHIGRAAVTLLEAAGWGVTMPTTSLCCGLTWISTGQLATARRILQRTVRALGPHLRNGGLVLGLEPSCASVFRSDAYEMLSDDADVQRLHGQTVTLAELLTRHSPGYQPPSLSGTHALAQVHCHQHAVLGWDADRELLRKSGVDIERLDSGCCGFAGNFGFERGHYEVSKDCAERVLLPRLRESESDTAVLADGFSCRSQIHELDSGGREGMHLAELLTGFSDNQSAPEDTR